MPPESWCGYSWTRRSGEGMPTRSSISIARSAAARCESFRCKATASAICAPTVCTGLSEVIGSWKIMAISAPRMARISSVSSLTRSLPSKKMLPAAISPGCSISRMMLSAVTLLPHPDSPTRPMIWPGWIAKEIPSTARANPARVRNWVVRPSTRSSAELGVADTRIEEGVGDVDDHVRRHDQQRAKEHRAHHERNVERKDGVDRLLADAGPREYRFDHDHAGEEIAEVHSELADDHRQGIGDRVFLDDLTLGQSLGPRGAHVVALQDVEQAGAQQPRVIGGATQAEGQGRQQQKLRSSAAITADREDGEQDAEQKEQEQAQPEGWRGQGDKGEHHGRPIPEAARPDGGKNPDRQADDELDEHAPQRQLCGGGKPLQNGREHWGLVPVRKAEVEVEDAPHVIAELRPQWPVEAELVVNDLDRRRRRIGAGIQAGGVPGDQEGDDEGDGGDAEEHEHHPGEPPNDVDGHRFTKRARGGSGRPSPPRLRSASLGRGTGRGAR